MTAPKHLWSGDWRRDSDAAARELAERRTPFEQPTPTPEETPPPEPRPSLAADVRAWLEDARRRARQRLEAIRSKRPDRTSLIVAAVLVSAAAAFAVVWTTVGSGGSSSTTGARIAAPAATGAAWLGLDTTNFAAAGGGGALVTDVVSGGPADAAGLQPGDLITQIGNTPIASPSVIAFALAGLHPGDPVQVQFQRGLFTNTAQVVLGSQPAHHP